jgi:hypothetical protein
MDGCRMGRGKRAARTTGMDGGRNGYYARLDYGIG